MTLSVEMIKTFGEFELRKADELECLAGGLTAAEAIRQSIEWSLGAYKVTNGPETVALWGYTPTSVLGEACYAWLLTGPGVDKAPYAFGRLSKYVISDLLLLFPSIFVTVDPAHTRAINWLRWLGFTTRGSHGPFFKMQLDRHS